jgi:mono/diheme cytochrome c family protein
VKRLSRLRRHRAAGPILLVFALFTIGTTFQVASAVSTTTQTTADRSAAIEEGKQLFLKGCSSCHGLNAEGGVVAPSLIGVGAASVDFQVGTGRMPMGDMSQQAVRKEPVYTPAEVSALAAYVHLLHQDLKFQLMSFLITNAMALLQKVANYFAQTARCATTSLHKVALSLRASTLQL